MCFADFRQLLDLFMTWDWSTYFYDYGQENSKYLKGERSRQEEKYIFSIKKESKRQEEVGRNLPKTAQTVNIKQ
ncbi:uncharacterized protein LOC143233504 isoform X7 [Tachypleus tridentatus]|uniref:uncharacterized protein LOC143233504 isoform X7 n=1 Tax=Tachypleus tridentatus TaxID=6853 RepID=UPI003FD3836A